jgi:hypothetical protein
LERRSRSRTARRVTISRERRRSLAVSFAATLTALFAVASCSAFFVSAAVFAILLTTLAAFVFLSSSLLFAASVAFFSPSTVATALSAFFTFSALTIFAALATAEADVRTTREAERRCGSRKCYHLSSRHRAIAHVADGPLAAK